MKRLINLKRPEARRVYGTYALVTLAYVILQIMISTRTLSSSIKGMLVPICAYMVMAVALNLVVGVLGELSLGHAGFMSVGAFTGVACAILLQDLVPLAPLRLSVSMAAGAASAALAGFLIGIPVLRLKGDYLAIVTLAFGEIIKSVLNNFYMGVDKAGLHFSMLSDKTGLAPGGRLIVGGPMGIGGIRKIATFGTGIALVVVYNLINSRLGRAFQAVRDDRIAAESVGIDVTRYKMTAFVVSAALAGAAGCLFAMNYSTIVANKFDFNTSILILVFVVLGGQGNMLGSIVAAAALTILPEKLREFRDYRMLIYAVLLIAIMLGSNNAAVRNFFARLKLFGPKAEEETFHGH